MSSSGSDALRAQYEVVLSFLEELFGANNVPQFAVTRDNVSSIFEVAMRVRRAEALAREELSDATQRADEYSRESARLSALLDTVQLSDSQLSAAGASALRSLAKASAALAPPQQLLTPSLAALFSAAVVAQDEKSRAVAARAAVRDARAKLDAQIKDVDEKVAKRIFFFFFFFILFFFPQSVELAKSLSALSKELGPAESDAAAQRQKLEYFQTKANEYDKNSQQHAAALSGAGFTEDVRHMKLVKQYEEIQQLEKEQAAVLAELEKFHGLDPHLGKAQASLDEAKVTLSKLKSSYAAELAKIAVAE